jgi:stalled ribosome alternative rescue factor ArfA
MKNDKEVKKVENSPPVKQKDGKGSVQRPFDKNTYRKNWDNVFKKIYD